MSVNVVETSTLFIGYKKIKGVIFYVMTSLQFYQRGLVSVFSVEKRYIFMR